MNENELEKNVFYLSYFVILCIIIGLCYGYEVDIRSVVAGLLIMDLVHSSKKLIKYAGNK